MAKFSSGAEFLHGLPWAAVRPPAGREATAVHTGHHTLAIAAGAFCIVAAAAVLLKVSGLSGAAPAEPVAFQPGPFVRAEVTAGYLSR